MFRRYEYQISYTPTYKINTSYFYKHSCTLIIDAMIT